MRFDVSDKVKNYITSEQPLPVNTGYAVRMGLKYFWYFLYIILQCEVGLISWYSLEYKLAAGLITRSHEVQSHSSSASRGKHCKVAPVRKRACRRLKSTIRSDTGRRSNKAGKQQASSSSGNRVLKNSRFWEGTTGSKAASGRYKSTFTNYGWSTKGRY